MDLTFPASVRRQPMLIANGLGKLAGAPMQGTESALTLMQDASKLLFGRRARHTQLSHASLPSYLPVDAMRRLVDELVPRRIVLEQESRFVSAQYGQQSCSHNQP